jgi:hypothetical protein
MSFFDEMHGFKAADYQTGFDPVNDTPSAQCIVKNHAVWSNWDPTPLISTTDCQDNALYLAKKRLENRSYVRVAVIDYKKVEEISTVYNMMSLAHSLGVVLARKAQNESEWVVVGCIPRISVLEVLDVPSFEDFCKRQGLLNASVLVLLSALFLISNILVRERPPPVALEKNGFVFFENWKEYDEWMHAKLNDPDFDPDP